MGQKTRQTQKKTENLRKIVEAITEVAEEDQIRAPTREEVAQHLDISENYISELVDGDYSHACRTAGYMPNRERTIGDTMVFYNELDKTGKEVTASNLQEKYNLSHLRQDKNQLTHDQARAKMGLEQNKHWPLMGIYQENYSGENNTRNLEHRIRELHHRKMEEEGRTFTNSELAQFVSKVDYSNVEEMREKAGIPFKPVNGSKTSLSPLTGRREDEIFEFWVNEFLEEDWAGKTDFEIDTIMKMRMQAQGINGKELDHTIDQYKRYMDFNRYE